MEPKWCLFTAYDSAFAELAPLSVPAMRTYAETHDMDFHEHVNWPCPRPAAWSKIYLALEKFAAGYDCIFWVDADAIIRRFDEDIRHHMRSDRYLYFALEDKGIRPSTVRLNSGVFVIRKSAESLRFLEAVLQQRALTHHKWWDQAAIIETLGLRSMFDGELHASDQPSQFAKLVEWLPKRWNSIAGRDEAADCVIRHFTTLHETAKQIGMRIDRLLDSLGDRSPATEAEFLTIVQLLWRCGLRDGHVRPRGRVRRTLRNFSRFIRGKPLHLESFP